MIKASSANRGEIIVCNYELSYGLGSSDLVLLPSSRLGLCVFQMA